MTDRGDRQHSGRRRALFRSRRRLVVAAAVLAPLLAGCGTGFQAETNQIYQPGPGISVRQDGVYGINMAIVTDGSGHGTLVAALINQQHHPDTLVTSAVKTSRGLPPVATILTGTVALPVQTSVQLGFTGVVRVEGTLAPGWTTGSP